MTCKPAAKPKLGGSGLRGNPPPWEGWQCKARKRGTNRRCKQWRLNPDKKGNGRQLCKWHFGTRDWGKRPSRLARYYSKVATPILRDKLEELRRMTPDERHDLSEEVDLARVLAGNALKLFEAAHYSDKSHNVSAKSKDTAERILRSAVTYVSDLVVKASKVRATNETVVDASNLDYIVTQVQDVIEKEVAAQDPKLADRVVEKLRSIKMPETKRGGGLSPREMADAMRATSDAIMKGIVTEEEEDNG